MLGVRDQIQSIWTSTLFLEEGGNLGKAVIITVNFRLVENCLTKRGEKREVFQNLFKGQVVILTFRKPAGSSIQMFLAARYDITLKLTCNGFRTSLYFLLPLLVFPSVITISTFEASPLSPPSALKILFAAISKARSVLVPPPVYLKALIASFSLESVWYSDFFRLNFRCADDSYTMAPTWVPCDETAKWLTRSAKNVKPLAKFALPTLPEPSIMRPTSNAFLQALTKTRMEGKFMWVSLSDSLLGHSLMVCVKSTFSGPHNC